MLLPRRAFLRVARPFPASAGQPSGAEDSNARTRGVMCHPSPTRLLVGLSFPILAGLMSCARVAPTPRPGPSAPVPDLTMAAVAPPAPLAADSFILPNGLRVLVHTDRKAPVVSVDVLYHVGSKDEQPGKSGLAHLVEHLMFYGTEHAPTDWFAVAARYGFTDLVGLTHNDVSRFAQTIPVATLETTLWLEAQRMANLAPALTQQKLDAQRRVVENEVAQGLNEPYGGVLERIARRSYPPDHPYHREVLGDMAELRTASVEDVRAWLGRYYTPNNAVLILAGDVDLASVRPMVERHFGPLTPGPRIERLRRWTLPMDADRHERVEQRVPRARLYRSWNIPGIGTTEFDHLRLLGDVLGSGAASRLHRALVATGIASDVSVWLHGRELSSSFIIQATANARGDSVLAVAGRIIDAEVARIIVDGPTSEELRSALRGPRNWFLRATERVGGYGGQSDQLGWSQVFGGRSDYHALQMTAWAEAKPEGVAAIGAAWLRRGSYTLEVHPIRELTSHDSVRDTIAPAVLEGGATAAFPTPSERTLPSGLRVVVLPRPGARITAARIIIGGGVAAVPAEIAGAGAVLMRLVAAGADPKHRAEKLSALGGEVMPVVGFDGFSLDVNAPGSTFAAVLTGAAAGVVSPMVSDSGVAAARRELAAAARGDSATARTQARRVLPALLYGETHPYAADWSGLGRSTTLDRVTPEAITMLHRTWFRPENAMVVIAGDLDVVTAERLVSTAFSGWRARPDSLPRPSLSQPMPRRLGDTIVVVDQPGATQAEIAVGFVAPPPSDATELRFEALGRAFAIGSSSRLGRNLRETKNWAYGTALFRPDAAGYRPFVVHTAVRPEHTGDAVAELLRELRTVAANGLSDDEAGRATTFLSTGFGGRTQTSDAVAALGARAARYDLSDTFFANYPAAIGRLTATELSAAAAELLPYAVVVVVGDWRVLEVQLTAAGRPPVKRLDAR